MRKVLLIIMAVGIAVGLSAFLSMKRAQKNFQNLEKEADSIIAWVEEYKGREGLYPNKPTFVIPGKEVEWTDRYDPSCWVYTSDGTSFSLYKYTGHNRDTIWYSSDQRNIWYLDDETGNPKKMLNRRASK